VAFVGASAQMGGEAGQWRVRGVEVLVAADDLTREVGVGGVPGLRRRRVIFFPGVRPR